MEAFFIDATRGSRVSRSRSASGNLVEFKTFKALPFALRGDNEDSAEIEKASRSGADWLPALRKWSPDHCFACRSGVARPNGDKLLLTMQSAFGRSAMSALLEERVGRRHIRYRQAPTTATGDMPFSAATNCNALLRICLMPRILFGMDSSAQYRLRKSVVRICRSVRGCASSRL